MSISFKKVINNVSTNQRPTLHLGVVAIETGTFGSPSTTVVNFTYLFTGFGIK